jgi:hypothetical protein
MGPGLCEDNKLNEYFTAIWRPAWLDFSDRPEPPEIAGVITFAALTGKEVPEKTFRNEA